MRAAATVILLMTPVYACAQDVFVYDFEQGDSLAAYEQLDVSKVKPEIISPGADGTGHCLKISNPERSKYCVCSP